MGLWVLGAVCGPRWRLWADSQSLQAFLLGVSLGPAGLCSSSARARRARETHAATVGERGKALG
eukprot:784897-Pyramimonas_sp.AAC.1